jgi:hypothetical protein
MKASSAFAATALAIFAMTGSAQASSVTETYDFTLSNFVDIGGGNVPAPYTTVTGSFTLTFDPTVTYTDQSAGLTVNSFSGGPIDSTLVFSTSSPGSPYFISIGGLDNGAGLIAYGTNDFVLQLRFADGSNLGSPELPVCTDPGYSCGGNPAFYASGYSLASYQSAAWFPTTASVSATPLPATLPLFATGLGGLGLLGWRRKRKAAALAA